jgi:hypothetical protein
MPDDIMPALDAEEWLEYGADRTVLRDFAMGKRPWGPRRRYRDEEKLHAVAAMSLYGQPFGFKQADVQLLEDEAVNYARRGAPSDLKRAATLRALAQRIAALIPPPGIEPRVPEGPTRV